MKKHDPVHRAEVPAARPSRQARLRALLFTASTLGTTLVMIGAVSRPKVPFGAGD